ncbi:putative RNA-directed DNA polymerase [Tanacetum coccineum]
MKIPDSIIADGDSKVDAVTSDDDSLVGGLSCLVDLRIISFYGKVKYSLNKYVNYANLCSETNSFVTNLNKNVETKTYKEASTDNRWVEAMNNEMEALNRNNTWDITDLPKGRKHIGCKGIYKVKYKFNGEVERYKARLVAKRYSQKEGIGYAEKFLPMLDVNDAFLYGDLMEDVYMSLPEEYFVNGDNRVLKLKKSLYGLKQAPIKAENDILVVFLVYVNDIIIIGNNIDEINKFKTMLSSKFLIKDLGKLKYLLGVEVIKHESGICFSQSKYCLELLNEFGMLGCKPASTPIEINTNKQSRKIIEKNDYPLISFGNYQKLVGKLIYLTITRPDISYVVHKLSQAMHGPFHSNLNLAFMVLSLSLQLSCDREKQEAIRVGLSLQLRLNTWQCLISATMQLALNPVFHERTKHFEIDLYFLREKIVEGIFKTCKIQSENNTTDVLTKGLCSANYMRMGSLLKLRSVSRIKSSSPHEVTIPNLVFRCSEFEGVTNCAPTLISQAPGPSRKRSRSPLSPFYLDATTFSNGKLASETSELKPEDVTARLEDIEVEINTLRADTEDKELLISELQDSLAAAENEISLLQIKVDDAENRCTEDHEQIQIILARLGL